MIRFASRTTRAAALLAALASLLSCSGERREVHVFAAISLTEAMTEAGAAYTVATGNEISFNFAASSTLAQQIEQGAPADLFASADEETMNRVSRAGFIDESTRLPLLSNTLALVTASDAADIATPADLARPGVRLALGDPLHVPAGVYARRYLTNAGLWDSIAPNVIPTDSVRSALAAVGSGNADAAFVYRTDTRRTKNIRVAWEVPSTEAPLIAYPFALIAKSPRRDEARAFLDYLASDEGKAIFRRHGFIVP